MNQLLAALGSDVKARGKDKWIAKCKVHMDKDFAMSIKLNSDNSVMAHCFACGANGLDLYNALGLDLDELFGKERDNSMPHNIKTQYDEDKWFMAIYNSDVEKGLSTTLQDKRRAKLAVARMAGIERKWGGAFN